MYKIPKGTKAYTGNLGNSEYTRTDIDWYVKDKHVSAIHNEEWLIVYKNNSENRWPEDWLFIVDLKYAEKLYNDS